MRNTIFSKIFSGYLLIIVVIIAFILLFFFRAIKLHYINTLTESLKKQANYALTGVTPLFQKGGSTELQNALISTADKSNNRLTITDKNGKVLVDSEQNPAVMDNHKSRKEILAALSGKTGTSLRYSSTLKKYMLYVALPIYNENNIAGTLRLSMFIEDIDNLLGLLKSNIIHMLLILLAITVITSFIFSKSLSSPIKELNKMANKVASGDFTSRLHLKNNDELHSLAESLNNMTEKIGELFNVRKDFVTNVSHEMRTPLAAIKGFAETLRDTVKGDDAHYVDIILKHSERLINIVNDLLALSNLERSRFKLELANVDLIQLIDDVTKLFDERVKKKGIDLVFSRKTNIKPIKADLFRLEQVFVNLIDNAIKYTEKGGISIDINQNDEYTSIILKDTGIGIPKEQLPRVFERFYVVGRYSSE